MDNAICLLIMQFKIMIIIKVESLIIVYVLHFLEDVLDLNRRLMTMVILIHKKS